MSLLNPKIVTVEDGDGAPYDLTECECDDTHEQNSTVCRWCWANNLIDGLTEQQVRYNIYAMGQTLKRFQMKLARVRTAEARAKWERKITEERDDLRQNEARLIRFAIVDADRKALAQYDADHTPEMMDAMTRLAHGEQVDGLTVGPELMQPPRGYRLLTTPSEFRDLQFDHVTIVAWDGDESEPRPLLSLVGVVYSEHDSGPDLFLLGDAAKELTGIEDIAYSCSAARPLNQPWMTVELARERCMRAVEMGLRTEVVA